MILAFSDDCMKLLIVFYIGHSIEKASFDLMDHVFLFQVINYQEESDTKDFLKALEH